MSIKLETTSKSFSVYGGLHVYENLLNTLSFKNLIQGVLPAYKISTASTPFDKFKALLSGFLCGADCLDDMDLLAEDPGFVAFNGDSVNASNTFGDFLRLFSDYDAKMLNHKLIETSLKLRNASHPKSESFVLDLDSTPHIQYGKKMEGLEFNYKKLWCLDSIQAFDQYGYEYWMHVRPGNTYSSNNAPEIIDNVLRKVFENNDKQKRFVRGDSAFCNASVFNAAKTAKAGFVVAMKSNIFEPLIDRVDNWKPSKGIKFYDGRSAEIGHTVYYPDSVRETLRVVMIRSLKEDHENMLLEESKYDYYAWVSNIPHSEMSNKTLIKFYRKRGQAENFIKELKYGFDMKHFPCLKLAANKAYGLIAAFAYTIMRYTSFLLNKKRPYYSKMVRFKLVYIACQVKRSGRQVFFKLNQNVERRLRDVVLTIKSEFGYV